MRCHAKRSSGVEYGTLPYHNYEIIFDRNDEWISSTFEDRVHLQKDLVRLWLTLDEYNACFDEYL